MFISCSLSYAKVLNYVYFVFALPLYRTKVFTSLPLYRTKVSHSKKRRLLSLLLFHDFTMAVNHVLFLNAVITASAFSVAVFEGEPVKHFSYLPFFIWEVFPPCDIIIPHANENVNTFFKKI